MYWSSALGELHNRDVHALLDDLHDDDVIDLAIADPPYNMGKAEWDSFDSREEYLEWVTGWVSTIGEHLSDSGSMYVMGLPEILAHVKVELDRNCDWIDSMRWLVWHYRNKPQMGDGGWTRSHESILWLRKTDDYTFNMDRVRIPYNNHTKRYPVREQGQTSLFGSEDGYEWDPNVEGAKPRDVIDVPTVNNASSERTDHPTQKPEELIRKLVWASSDRGDTVFDPFGGSGTTYVVCEQLGREWIGCEAEEKYCEMTVDRLESVEHREDPSYWMKHDIDRRENRRKIRYGEEEH